MITGLYAAFFAVFQMVMIPWIVRSRVSEKMSLGMGSEILQRKVRVYGNFVETVPMVLVLMLIAELSGSPFWALHGIGVLMVVSRLSHAFGMMRGTGINRFREIGVMLTMVSLVAGAALCAALAFKIF